MSFVTRFAPSPTGYLHLGHAFSALLAHQAAQEARGGFLLRIEDIDASRARPEFEAAIFEDLAWLGLDWERPPRRQSDHLASYREALERLRDEGLLYRCFRTRRELAEDIAGAPHRPAEAFQGEPLPPAQEAERLARGEPFAWRLSLAAARRRLGGAIERLTYVEEAFESGARETRAFRPDLVGDVVLARKDVGAAYHLASVLDDADQGVTHVIRGVDLAEAVHVHLLLQTLLGLPQPIYRHHPLVSDGEGRRLAKRARSTAIRDFRALGLSPAEVLDQLPPALRRRITPP